MELGPEIIARLDALYTDPPWRSPQPLPAPATGDPELDALFDTLEKTAPHEAALGPLVLRIGGDERPVVRETVMRWIQHVFDDRAPAIDPAAPPIADLELRNAVVVRAQPVRVAWYQRNGLLAGLFGALAVRPDEAIADVLVGWLERLTDPTQIQYAANAVFAMPEGAARERAFAGVARHLVPGDALAPLGAVALALRDEAAAAPTVREQLAKMDASERGLCAIHLSRRAAKLDLDACPDWVDILYPGVLGQPWAIEASYALHNVRTSEPLLRALRHTDVDVYWTDILGRLRTLDDPGAAGRLEALASTLPAQEKGQRLSRTSNTVLALVKRLRRKRDVVDRASFETKPGVGTDGGPIVVLGADAAAAWQGVPSDWTGEGGDSDYDRACAASDEGMGSLKVSGKRAFAIGEQNVGLAMLADGAPMLVVRGTDLQLEIAMRERGAWKKTRMVLEVGQGGAVILDAAHTVASAPEGAQTALDLAPGTYDIVMLRRDDVLAMKLVPAKPKRT